MPRLMLFRQEKWDVSLASYSIPRLRIFRTNKGMFKGIESTGAAKKLFQLEGTLK